MLRYRVGCGNGSILADYYKSSEHLSEMLAALARYYTTDSQTPAIGPEAYVRPTTHPIVRQRLGIDPTVPLTTKQLGNLLNGQRADGEKIPGKAPTTNTFIDFVFTAPKSFSVALVMASPRERALLEKAYSDAVNKLMDLIAETIGTASVGRTAGNRASNREEGHIAMIPIEHYTARPTYQLARGQDTEVIEVMMPGDPNRHTHILTLNAAFTEDGRVTSLHQDALDQRIHEWGALGQAFLGTELMKLGVNWELDSTPNIAFNERMGRLTDVPRWACDLFSKRHKDGEKAAVEFAKSKGFDLHTLSPEQKASVLTGGILKTRQAKVEGLNEYESWIQQAKDADYKYRSVLRPGQERTLRPAHVRQQEAYAISLPLIDEHFERRAVLEGSIPRVAAAKGFIHTGIADAREVNVVTAAHRSEGVLQDGEQTFVHWGWDTGTHYARVTTELSVEREREVIAIFRAAAADKSVALSTEEIERAVKKVETESAAAGKPIDFSTEHGIKQRALIDRIAPAGRAIVWIGAAGAGKSTALRVPVSVFHERGRDVWGATPAWRQTEGLVDAGINKNSKKGWLPDINNLVDSGIERDKARALEPFLRNVEKGQIKLTENSTVVVDELGLVSTRQVLRLARLQAQYGFQFIGLGDDMQCQSIEAGATIDLARRAFGKENVPELLDSIRQVSIRDRETVQFFRQGKADVALKRMDEDRSLHIVPGGYEDAVKATVALYFQRIEANANKPGYTIGITVPTNADGRAIGERIQQQRQAKGEIGPDFCEISATDQGGEQYKMRLAAGSRVRLFNRVRSKTGQIVGNNGSVVEVIAATQDGMRVKTAAGKATWVGWESLRSKDNPNIRLSYGDAVTVEARQSETLDENITATVGGSSMVNGFAMYVSGSRHRIRSHIVTSQGAEKAELVERRPLGSPENLETDPIKIKAAIMENMARNLSRQPKKTLALDFLDRALEVKSGTIGAKAAAWFQEERRQQEQGETSPGASYPKRQPRRHPERLSAPQKRITGPAESRSKQPPVREAKRSMRSPAERPKHQKAKPVDISEAIDQFRDALQQEGFIVDRDPVMDGQWHRARVQGDKGHEESGRYRAYLDSRPAGAIQNFRVTKAQGAARKWKMDGVMEPLSADEKRRMQDERVARESARRASEEAALRKITAIWEKSYSVTRHPYLTKKGVQSHGLRQDRHGNLVAPYRNASGNLTTIQLIKPDGSKIFPSGAKKHGSFGVIGKVDPDGVLLIAEGYATAATLHELTGLPVAYAADAGNMVPAGRSIRQQFPNVQFGWAGDNDHHLPRKDPPQLNEGREAVAGAAKELGGFVLIPNFGAIETQPLIEGSKPPTDWNDHKAIFSEAKTRADLKLLLQKEGVTMSDQIKRETTVREQPTQTDRDAARRVHQPAAPQPNAQAAAAQEQAQRRQMEHRQHNKGPEL